MKIVVAIVSYDSVLYLVGRCAFDVVLFQTSFVRSPAYQAATAYHDNWYFDVGIRCCRTSMLGLCFVT